MVRLSALFALIGVMISTGAGAADLAALVDPMLGVKQGHGSCNHLIDYGNEPSFMTIWLYDAVRRPYLASYWADRLRAQFDDNGYPGDEDGGAMSSLYVFLTAGIFPFAGQDVYYLHAPGVHRLTFHVEGGREFTIVAHNASPESRFIQSVRLRGEPLNDPWIRHSDLLRGGVLEFTLGPQPSGWGCNGEFDAAAAAMEVPATK